MCRAYRAFELLSVNHNPIPVMSIGVGVVDVYQGIPDYWGKCSHRHPGMDYAPLTFVLAPFEHRTLKTFERELRSDYPLRNIPALRSYLSWRASFRKKDVEAHFAPGHVCSEACPEYEWPEEIDW